MPFPTFTHEVKAEDQWAGVVVAKTHDDVFTRVTKSAAALLATFVDPVYHFSCKETSVLELGAGTGVLADYVLKEYPECRRYLATDFSAEMLAVLKVKLASHEEVLRTKLVDATKLEDMRSAVDKFLGADGITHLLSQFMHQHTKVPIMTVYNCVQLLREQRCESSIVGRSPGVLGLVSWGKVNDIETVFNTAMKRMNPNAVECTMYSPEWPRTKNEVKKVLENMSVHNVFADAYTFHFEFKSVKEFLKFFFEGKHPTCEELLHEVNGKDELKKLRTEMKHVLEEERLVKVEKMEAEIVVSVGKVL